MAVNFWYAVGTDLLRQAEDALTDDVLLDLRRARVDRAGTRPEKRGRERARLSGRRRHFLEHVVGRAGHELAPRAEDLEGQLEEALLELGVGELGDRRRGADRLSLRQRGEHAQRGVALDFEIGERLAEPRAHDGSSMSGNAVALHRLRRLHELVERHQIARDPPEGVRAALVAERRLRDLPARR